MSNKDTLPPLPEPAIRPFAIGDCYTSDQMHTYAAACILDAQARGAIAAQAPQQAQEVAAPKFNTSKAGREQVAKFFAEQLKRYDFADYIKNTLAADFACALAPTLYKLAQAPAPLPLPVQAEPDAIGAAP